MGNVMIDHNQILEETSLDVKRIPGDSEMNQANENLRDEGLGEGAAGKLIGVVGHTMRKWRQLGIGPEYIRISARCVRYRRSDILRWLESRRVKPVHEVSDAQ
jgi:hypothetical protein